MDRLWYLAEEACQQAEQAAHRLASHYDDYLEVDHERRVSRRRFRTLADRIRETGAPYGAHTIAYRPDGSLLLVRHEEVDMWVLPGGQQEGEETFREAAERELAEEAGVAGEYQGLALLTRVQVRHGDHELLGVMPVFAAAATGEPSVADPDGEISEARWFEELPADTRDRADLLRWRDRYLS
ncbi:NUDIX domain-containing protein [Halosegnis sp.]|uniref:NUDIX domain-containing protein n=1 Tax=Halosegnis sp. TaxID=2864959 RepID=UPI0035D4693F